MAEWIGRTLSKVKLERLIGRGGMAEVYLGRHLTLDRPVAVKILHAHLSDDPALMSRFRREAQAVAALRHPNIVNVLDLDIVEERPYIVMELLDGLSLADYLRGVHAAGHSLPLPTIVRIVHDVAAALDYAHTHGIVHRDVKPANVMIRRPGPPLDARLPLPPDAQAVLTDFGIAHMAGSATQTASGTVLGTPAYMSPEQVRGEPVDGRSDVYSLGIITYEMLAGRLPFESENTTPASLLIKHITVEPPPIPNTAPGIQTAVDRALAKQPAARTMTAGAFARDLAQAAGEPTPLLATLHDHPAQPSGPLAPTMVRTPARRRSPATTIVGLVAALTLLAIPGLVLLRGRAPNPPAAATADASAVAPTEAGGQDTPSAAGPLAASGSTICATALVTDSTISIVLNLPPAPSGSAYAAWLATADGQVVPLGFFDAADPQPVLTYQDRDGRNLAEWFDRIDLAPVPLQTPPGRPPVVPCSAQFEAELLEQVRFLGEVAAGQPLSAALSNGLQTQAVHFTSHQVLTVSGVTSGELTQAQAHAEHLINIVEGSRGQMYGDWNSDGLVQNPGDDFGLTPYLRLLIRLMDPASDASAIQVADTLAEDVESARDLAQRIAAADSLEEVTGLAQSLAAIEIETRISTMAGSLAGRSFSIGVEILSGAR